MINIYELARAVKSETRHQQTDIPFEDEDYVQLVKRALRDVFIVTGKAAQYDETKMTGSGENEQYDANFSLIELEYIHAAAMVFFYQQVAQEVDNIVGYSNDAIAVTNSDKPFVNIMAALDRWWQRLVELAHKLNPFAVIGSDDS